MQENRLPLSEGWNWTVAAWKILSTAPLTVFAIVGAYVCLLFIANLPSELLKVPYVGILLSSVVTPFNALAFATCGRDVYFQRRPNMLTCYAEGWKDKTVRVKLVSLGLIYGFCVIAIGLLTDLLSASAKAHWTAVEGGYSLESVLNNIPWTALIIGSILYVALLCVTCFSPMLIAWRKQSIGKAFFFSLIVCLRNVGPIIVLGLILALLASGGAVMLGSLGSLGSVLIVFWGIVITALSYSSLWPMWQSIFGSQNSDV